MAAYPHAFLFSQLIVHNDVQKALAGVTTGNNKNEQAQTTFIDKMPGWG